MITKKRNGVVINMVALGEIMGGENSKKGYFIDIKCHWADIANVLISIDPHIINDMTMEDIENLANNEYKNIIYDAMKKAMDTELNKISVRVVNKLQRQYDSLKTIKAFSFDTYLTINKTGLPDASLPVFKYLQKKLTISGIGNVTQRSLIRALNIPTRTIRYTLRRMSERGIIRKVPNLYDMRNTFYTIDDQFCKDN